MYSVYDCLCTSISNLKASLLEITFPIFPGGLLALCPGYVRNERTFTASNDTREAVTNVESNQSGVEALVKADTQ